MTQPTWTTALPDWERRIVAGESLLPCEPLFPDEAAAAMEIFESLRIVDAVGSPRIGESCRPWVKDFARAIFGAYNAETGRRLIRNFLLLISKKNAKSTTGAAAVMLTALLRNWRKSAEFLILAPTIEIANNSFGPAADMVAADDELKHLLHVQPNVRTIKHLNTGATLKVVAADSETVGGKKAVAVAVDELWLFGKRANAENMLREAIGGLASRPEGFVVYFSTQSDEPPAGIFKQELDRFRDIRDGKLVDPKSLGVIYEFPKALIESGAYRDPANFYVTNPNLGVSVDREFLVDEFAKAERAGEQSFCGFAAKHLNVQIGINLRANRWPGAEFWARQSDRDLTLETVLDRSECVVVGVDGGGLDDLFGLVVLGRDRETKHWLCWARAWCHKGVLERRQSIAATLRDFERAGELTIVDDKLEDMSEIVNIIADIHERGLLASVAVDPAGLGEFVDDLAQIGVTQEAGNLKGAPQGYAMMNAIKTSERKLANGTLWHSGSSLMSWAVGNLKIVATDTAIKATKMNAGDAKIDPVMALFDAVTVMSLSPAIAPRLDVAAMIA